MGSTVIEQIGALGSLNRTAGSLRIAGILCVIIASALMQMTPELLVMIFKATRLRHVYRRLTGAGEDEDGVKDVSFHDIILDLSRHSMLNSSVHDLDMSAHGTRSRGLPFFSREIMTS